MLLKSQVTNKHSYEWQKRQDKSSRNVHTQARNDNSSTMLCYVTDNGNHGLVAGPHRRTQQVKW